jgi:hypothetical protein
MMNRWIVTIWVVLLGAMVWAEAPTTPAAKPAAHCPACTERKGAPLRKDSVVWTVPRLLDLYRTPQPVVFLKKLVKEKRMALDIVLLQSDLDPLPRDAAGVNLTDIEVQYSTVAKHPLSLFRSIGLVGGGEGALKQEIKRRGDVLDSLGGVELRSEKDTLSRRYSFYIDKAHYVASVKGEYKEGVARITTRVGMHCPKYSCIPSAEGKMSRPVSLLEVLQALSLPLRKKNKEKVSIDEILFPAVACDTLAVSLVLFSPSVDVGNTPSLDASCLSMSWTRMKTIGYYMTASTLIFDNAKKTQASTRKKAIRRFADLLLERLRARDKKEASGRPYSLKITSTVQRSRQASKEDHEEIDVHISSSISRYLRKQAMKDGNVPKE